jgi:hypothetical protein
MCSDNQYVFQGLRGCSVWQGEHTRTTPSCIKEAEQQTAGKCHIYTCIHFIRVLYLCHFYSSANRHTLGIGLADAAILIIIEGQFQAFQRFSSSKLVLKAVESRFTALNYYENGNMYW